MTVHCTECGSFCAKEGEQGGQYVWKCTKCERLFLGHP